MNDEAPDSPVHADDEAGLLGAVNQLSERVFDLTEKLTLNQMHARRTRRISIAVFLVFVLVVGGGFINSGRIQTAVDTNKDTQVQQCENANSVREANTILWSTVLGFSADGEQTPEMTQATAALLDWINVLYQPRDCTDLDRVYEAPPPPDLSQFFDQGARNGP